MEKVSSKRANSFGADEKTEIVVALNAGACFGVVRAIKLGRHALRRGGDVSSLGPLIHNPMVVAELEQEGLVNVESAGDVAGGTVLLRSHGVTREVEAQLRAKKARIVDATCPLVKKPQRIAQSLGEKGCFLVLVGDEKHPEVQGVLSYFGRPDYLVTYSPSDVDRIPERFQHIGVLGQTTIEAHVFEEISKRCQRRAARVDIFNTICEATSVRQFEADLLARTADVVIVVGGRNSSNTRKLERVCVRHQPHTYLIERSEELEAAWFQGKRKVAVTGGASTPQEYVDEVGERIAQLIESTTITK